MKRQIAIFAVLCIASIGALGNYAQAAEQVADPFVECVKAFTAEPHYALIATKLPLADFDHITFNMLADQSKPTPLEREDIAEWFDRRDACWSNSAAYHNSNWPAEFVQLAEQGNIGVKEIGVDLYNRKITYGDANKRFQELGNGIKAKVAALVKQYQTQTAVLQAQAAEKADRQRESAEQQRVQEQQYADSQARQDQALRQQRAQAFLGYMQQQQLQQQQQQHQLQLQQLQQYAPRPTYNTNCYTAGSNTSCTTH
jgi:hypothetical protein